MRLLCLALLTATLALPTLAQPGGHHRGGDDRQVTVVERHGRRGSELRVEGQAPGVAVVVEKRAPRREVIVGRREPARTVVVERREPARTVVVERREPPRQVVVHYRSFSESPREWRVHHEREFVAHAYYSDHDRLILRGYGRRHHHHMHPGWRERIVVGEPVPSDVVVEPVPVEVERDLPPLPENYVRFRIGSSFFIKDVHTGIVIDAAF